ncbi:cbb3-type cytochrome oxidase assembly protein CcoS [Euryhalocaulis caribicus]|uniref:cbb3-type cytochrome oxidase assembly protein CcoS n=1 Tax=Euryhalocaulis caribicus TaxID=1161401 RepID=UPI0009DBB149|nr:cbb3-type cytochrome oxidase assembly protein CcoS [Euryhalocaulis caribicus]
MSILVWLIPIALGMGSVALCAFLWSMRSGQYEDLDGAAERVLLDQQEDRPIIDESESTVTENNRKT